MKRKAKRDELEELIESQKRDDASGVAILKEGKPGKDGAAGVRGPSGDISTALANCQKLLDEFRTEILTLLAEKS